MKEIMEALLRIEKKQDEVLKLLSQDPLTLIQPMSADGQVCPLCKQAVVYRKEPISGQVWRSCGCAPNIKEN